MALETKCQTPGATFSTKVTERKVSCDVRLPFALDLTGDEAELLISNVHNALEMVLSRYWEV